MNGTKIGWIFPIVTLIALIAVIWMAISEYKSGETVEAPNDTVISGSVE